MPQETLENARWLIGAIARQLNAAGQPAALRVLARLAEQNHSPAAFTLPGSMRLPVLRHFADAVGEAMLVSPDTAAALAAVEDQLHWRQSEAYSDALLGDGFMENYGWCQLLGPHGFFPGQDFLLGLLMLGPGQHYRNHAHPAPELYVPLTGGSSWSRNREAFAPKPAGSLIWHEPQEVHATRTEATPLLAIWCWTADVAEPARLV